jgi:hypothetical protein
MMRLQTAQYVAGKVGNGNKKCTGNSEGKALGKPYPSMTKEM